MGIRKTITYQEKGQFWEFMQFIFMVYVDEISILSLIIQKIETLVQLIVGFQALASWVFLHIMH